MKLLQFIFVCLLVSLFIFLVNGLTLKKRVGDQWQIVANSTDGKVLNYQTLANKVDLLQFRVDREDDSRILNDLYINVTSVRYSRLSLFFNNFELADSNSDNRGRMGYTPIWFASCGAVTPYFSLASNNSYTSDLFFTVTVRDEIVLCDYK